MCVGVLICWGTTQIGSYIIRDIQGDHNIKLIMKIVYKWLIIATKVIIIGMVGLSIPPLLIGILNEVLFWVPLSTPLNETPKYPLFRCWALGLLYLKGWIK